MTLPEINRRTVVALAAALIPAAFVVGAAVSLTSSGIAGASALGTWIGIYLVWNLDIVPERTWVVVERFGEFHSVKFAGLRFYCMRGIIDVMKNTGSLKETKQRIFEDPRNTKSNCREAIDFTDASVPIDAYAWFRVGDPDADEAALERDIIAYVYANDDPVGRAVHVIEDVIRPELQKMTTDQASKERATMLDTLIPKIKVQLQAYGLYLPHNPPIVIADIDLSPEVELLRQRRLEGLTAADKSTAEAVGFAKSIDALMYEYDKEGTRLGQIRDREAALAIWREQQQLSAFRDVKPSVNLIGATSSQIITMLGTPST